MTSLLPARVFVVKGYDEEHGWAVAVFVDKVRAEELASDLQAEAESSLEGYLVSEVPFHA
jgi:hypothetical protein